jgi:hypothetical protein
MAQVVGIVGLVADQDAGCGGAGEQMARAMDVVGLAGRQEQGVEPPLAIGERVELGVGAAARASDRLVWPPPFAPAAARCARISVRSTMATTGGSSQAASAAKSSCHRPRSLQRLNSAVRGPYSAGIVRYRRPSL